MPVAAPKLCSYPGCNALAVGNGSRCAKHKPKAWDHGKTAAQRGYGSRWRKLRKVVLVRDDYLCCVCGRSGATEVDHITPKALGGSDSVDNLQAICSHCHRIKSKNESSGSIYKPIIDRPPSCKVFVVWGPPGAGKSTYVQKVKGRNDLVIDLDVIIEDMSGKPRYEKTKDELIAGIKKRNAMLCSDLSGFDALWFITSGDSYAHWVEQLKADLVCIVPSSYQVELNITKDKYRNDVIKQQHLQKATRFYKSNANLSDGGMYGKIIKYAQIEAQALTGGLKV